MVLAPSWVAARAHPCLLSGSPVYPSWQTQIVSGSPPSPLISCRHSARGPHCVSWHGEDGDSSWRTTSTQQLLSSTGLSTQSTESPQVPRRCRGKVHLSEQLTLPVSSHSQAESQPTKNIPSGCAVPLCTQPGSVEKLISSVERPSTRLVGSS